LGGQISSSREGKNGSTLPLCYLRQDVGRSAKAIEANLFPFTSDDERTPADQSSAKQRSERHVAASFAERKGEARIGNNHRRETAIAGEAGEERMVAKIFGQTPQV